MLHKELLFQFAICVAPLPPAFFFGHFAVGGISFTALLLMFLTYQALRKNQFHFVCLLVSSIPLLVFIRGAFIPFNSIVVLLGCGLVTASLAKSSFKEFWKRKTLLCMIVGSMLFWWASYLLSGNYENNLRALEWSFSAAVVFMLSERRSYLCTAIVGWGISVTTAGLMLLPYGDRLGMTTINGATFGNPILLGLSSALVLLLCIADGGRWLLLDRYPVWRVALSVVCGIFLVFSTSRGSWIVAVVGLGVLAVFDRRARTPMLVSGLVLALSVGALSNSSRIQTAKHYLVKTTSADSSAAVKTGGRNVQWQAFPEVLRDSPVWGFGPGSGRAVAYAYSGANLQWHSLYLQVGAEMGVLGLTILFVLLGVLIRDDLAHFSRRHEIVPLLGTMSFMVYGLSVSGFDSVGGMLLGLGFIGGNRSNLWIVREIVVPHSFRPAGWHGPDGTDGRRFAGIA